MLTETVFTVLLFVSCCEPGKKEITQIFVNVLVSMSYFNICTGVMWLMLFLWALLALPLYFVLMLWTFRGSGVFHHIQKRRYREFWRIEEIGPRKSREKVGEILQSILEFAWTVGIIVSVVACGRYLLSSHSRGFGSRSCCFPPAPASCVWALHPDPQSHLETSLEMQRISIP